MKLFNKGSIAFAAVALVSMNAYASDDNGFSAASGGGAVPVLRSQPHVRQEGAWAACGKCPLSNAKSPLVAALIGAGVAYVGEHELVETLNSYQKSGARGFGRFVSGVAITGVAVTAGLMALGGEVLQAGDKEAQQRLGFFVLAAMVAGVKLWKQEPQIVQDEVDQALENAIAPDQSATQPSSSSSSSSASATDADASKAKAAAKK